MQIASASPRRSPYASARRSIFWPVKSPCAPRWIRRVGLEWLHRLTSEPRRLAKLYLRDAWSFPQFIWREWAQPFNP